MNSDRVMLASLIKAVIGKDVLASRDAWRPAIRPAGFSFPFAAVFPWQIWVRDNGDVKTDFNPDAFYPHSGNQLFAGWKHLYLDNVSGASGNDGLTYATPKQAFSSIVTLVNAATEPGCVVWVKYTGTDYIRSHSWNGGTRLNKSVAIVGYGNSKPVFGMHDNAGTWALDGTYTNCYSVGTFATVQNVANMLNFDEFGYKTLFTDYGTPAALDAAPAGVDGYAVDGSKTYVRRADGAVPSNTNTRCYRPSVEGPRGPTAGNCYVWNLNFEGGNNGNFIGDSNPTGRVMLFNVGHFYAGRPSGPTDACKARDIYSLIAYRNVFAYASSDGFDLTPAGSPTTIPVGVAIECISLRNGSTGTQSNNGFTGHGGSKTILIGGASIENYGGNVAYIDDDTQVWAICHSSIRSLGDIAVGGTIAPVNYQTLEGCEMWLDTCYSERDPTDATARDFAASGATNGSYIYHRNMQFAGDGGEVMETRGGGRIATYEG